MLCEFYDPVDPSFLMFEMPLKLYATCLSLKGEILPLNRVVDLLRAASEGQGIVKAEEGYISWVIGSPTPQEVADALEKSFGISESDAESSEDSGVSHDGSEEHQMSRADIR